MIPENEAKSRKRTSKGEAAKSEKSVENEEKSLANDKRHKKLQLICKRFLNCISIANAIAILPCSNCICKIQIRAAVAAGVEANFSLSLSLSLSLCLSVSPRVTLCLPVSVGVSVVLNIYVFSPCLVFRCRLCQWLISCVPSRSRRTTRCSRRSRRRYCNASRAPPAATLLTFPVRMTRSRSGIVCAWNVSYFLLPSPLLSYPPLQPFLAKFNEHM